MTSTLSQDEELTLRAFHRQVERLRRSSIGRQGQVQVSSTTNFDFRTGNVTTTFTGFDQDAFQSQLPVLRQFVLNDAVSFNHICNVIYQRCGRPELLAWVREARRRWNENLQQVPDAMHQHLHKATSSLEDAIEKLFYGYGGLFHVDIHAPKEEENVAAVEQQLLHRAFPKMCWCLNVIDSVIYWWLDAPGETVPAVPTP